MKALLQAQLINKSDRKDAESRRYDRQRAYHHRPQPRLEGHVCRWGGVKAFDVVNLFRDRPAGTLRLNAPVSAAQLVLPAILPGFPAAYPDIQVEIIAEDGFVDMVASGCDAGRSRI